MFFFNQKTAGLSDERLKTPLKSYIFSRQKELILDLVAPRAGERVLDIGCGTGENLQLFRDKWCSVTGIDSSAELLKVARMKHGGHAELILAQAEDIPFSDNEFDIVTLVNVLETANDPRKVIAEAIRVCGGRVFIGFLNSYSLAGTRQRLKEISGFSVSQKIHFFSLNEIRTMVRSLIGDADIKWGSVLYFPGIVYGFFEHLEGSLPLEKNPFGAFVGLTFSVNYTYRTAQSPIMESFELNSKARNTAPEAVRGMLRQADK
jgi:SAM-dependent methyltransferase